MQITTITFFRYHGLKSKLWAFGMMQFAHNRLAGVDGLAFYKLLGTGKGQGFNPLPDWSTYALLQVWENEDHANSFFENSSLFRNYKKNSIEHWTIFMFNISAQGEWGGKNPFIQSDQLLPNREAIAVITRATIRKKMLVKFWRYVPTSEKPLSGNTGLLYKKGIGEAPLVQMATFSIWKDKSSLMEFAYRSKEHNEAIKKTKELNWYKEELFSRFQPYKSIGSWHGTDPLADSLQV
ncbi:MAG: DUF3291 domain-containing protein [Bacteroidota bacterium]